MVLGLAEITDHVLCMTVNPGWGGQAYIPTSTGRVARLRELLGPRVPIQVDGGIDATSVGPASAAGASLFVAGSSLFGAADPPAAYRELVASAGAV